MSFPPPPSFFLMRLRPWSSHLCKCYSTTPLSPIFSSSPRLSVFHKLVLCNIDVFTCLFISLCSLSLSLSTEWYLVWAVLLRRVQGHEPHAVHRLWPAGPGESIRYLAHHAEYDCRSYLLCCFHWPCNSSYSVPGLLQTAVSGKGEKLH